MALHFERAEFEGRIAAARRAMNARGLAAVLLFAQESHYYLTGYDTSGYVFFQCTVLTADAQPITLLTRRPNLEQARRSSVIEDVRVWYDAEGAAPADDLRGILAEKGLAGAPVRGAEDQPGRLVPARGCVRPGAHPAAGEIAGGARLCAPRGGTGRCIADGDAGRGRPGRLRGRYRGGGPGGDPVGRRRYRPVQPGAGVGRACAAGRSATGRWTRSIS